MSKYELTIVLPEKATPAKKKSVTEGLEKTVKIFKGEVKKTEDWGLVPLAYKIMKQTSGNFLFFELELDKASVKGFNDKLRTDEAFIRYLLVSV